MIILQFPNSKRLQILMKTRKVWQVTICLTFVFNMLDSGFRLFFPAYVKCVVEIILINLYFICFIVKSWQYSIHTLHKKNVATIGIEHNIPWSAVTLRRSWACKANWIADVNNAGMIWKGTYNVCSPIPLHRLNKLLKNLLKQWKGVNEDR